MSSGTESQESLWKRFIFSSGPFRLVCAGAIFACIVGMIYCCISFCITSKKFSAECTNVLNQIQSVSLLSNYTGASSEYTPDMSSKGEDKTEILISHMESMIAIQKSGMTNDLMSFIYGILSAVLVGLCASFVAKSRTNADEAKKTADEAKENAKSAKNQAEIAEVKAKETKSAIEQAQNVAKTAKELQYQLRLVIISGSIMSAKSAFLCFDYIATNRTISQIRDEIQSLFSDVDFKHIMKSDPSDRMGIGIVYSALFDLSKTVEEFLNACENGNVEGYLNMCKNDNADAVLESMKTAAKNYRDWIQSALNRIDAASDEIQKPLK